MVWPATGPRSSSSMCPDTCPAAPELHHTLHRRFSTRAPPLATAASRPRALHNGPADCRPVSFGGHGAGAGAGKGGACVCGAQGGGGGGAPLRPCPPSRPCTPPSAAPHSAAPPCPAPPTTAARPAPPRARPAAGALRASARGRSVSAKRAGSRRLSWDGGAELRRGRRHATRRPPADVVAAAVLQRLGREARMREARHKPSRGRAGTDGLRRAALTVARAESPAPGRAKKQ